MASVKLIGAAAVIIEYVLGIGLNMSILLVYIVDLKNGLSLGPSDMIHFTKALVNVSTQILMILRNTIFFGYCLYLIQDIFPFFLFSNLFIVIYNSWLMALLCAYYYTNITSWGHRGLAWLKRSLQSYLLHILLVSGLGSVTLCSPILWFRSPASVRNGTDQCTTVQGGILLHTIYRIIIAMLGCVLPFSIRFISTILTSWSLINHMWRMKQNNIGSKLQTQINATRTMILFLLHSVIINVVVYVYLTVAPRASDVDVVIFWIVFIFFLVSESFIIIQSSVKLRKTLVGKFFVRARRRG